MKFWLLERKYADYDEIVSMVVRAGTESAARAVAHDRELQPAFEGDRPTAQDRKLGAEWLDESLATCVEVAADGPAEVIHTFLLKG